MCLKILYRLLQTLKLGIPLMAIPQLSNCCCTCGSSWAVDSSNKLSSDYSVFIVESTQHPPRSTAFARSGQAFCCFTKAEISHMECTAVINKSNDPGTLPGRVIVKQTLCASSIGPVAAQKNTACIAQGQHPEIKHGLGNSFTTSN